MPKKRHLKPYDLPPALLDVPLAVQGIGEGGCPLLTLGDLIEAYGWSAVITQALDNVAPGYATAKREHTGKAFRKTMRMKNETRPSN